MSAMLVGFSDALRPDVLLSVFVGILLGYVIGVLPGLNRPAALAIAIPLSYYMNPVAAVGFLIGIAKASGAGGATSAIMLNIPGEPNAVVTCLDGYPMARAGKAEKALKIALYGSVIGDILATIVLIIAARPLATAALHFGPLEMTGIMLISLTFIAGLSSGSVFKGMAAGALGVLASTIGIDAETATPRLTFGQVELMDGIPLLVVTVGMLALSEMFIQVESYRTSPPSQGVLPEIVPSQDRALGWKEFLHLTPTIGRSSAIGIGIGLLPGLGPTIASFASYAYAKRAARPGDQFGQGEPKGVAAAETADNAVVPASLIPLFALGIPGSVSAAILVGAFTIHGVTPGPRMFETHARLVYGVYGAMLVASIFLLVVGRFGLIAFAKLNLSAGDHHHSRGDRAMHCRRLYREPLGFCSPAHDRLRDRCLCHAPVRLFANHVSDRVHRGPAVRAITQAIVDPAARLASGAAQLSVRDCSDAGSVGHAGALRWVATTH